jgi:hypothetical protein
MELGDFEAVESERDHRHRRLSALGSEQAPNSGLKLLEGSDPPYPCGSDQGYGGAELNAPTVLMSWKLTSTLVVSGKR